MSEFTNPPKSTENLRDQFLEAGADYVIVNLVDLKEFIDKLKDLFPLLNRFNNS